MKKAVLCLVFAVTALAAADFKTGLEAYNRGDYAAALREWQPLADKGDANSEYNLGLLYARGQGVERDYKKAAEWYQKAAAQGVAAAQYNLGVMYANGQGVESSPENARKWFFAAAEQGVGDAAQGLGNIYAESQGAFHNPAEAEKWYRQAAGQGIASAAFNLGVMYDIGQGVTKNYDEALKWYRQAADAGYAPALTNIGILYYNAQGVKRDLQQSYAWFARAEKLGDPRGKQLITSASSKMTPSQIKKAQAMVDRWQPSSKPPAAVDTALFKPPAAGETAAQAAATQAATTPTRAATTDAWSGVERIIAVGDVHGDFEQFVAVLRSANLVDDYGNWTGGKTHLVQTGDIVDRGPDSRAVMDLLMKPEKQARAAGGAVHCLTGNHEAMDVYGDVRFVSPGEYASYLADQDRAERPAAYGAAGGALAAPSNPLEAPAAPASSSAVPGFREHRAAFAADGMYGRWIRSHNAIIKIDRTLFVHAGLGPKYASWPMEKINDEVRRELDDFTTLHGGIVIDEQGPLWFNGLAKGDPERMQPLVDQLLKAFGVDRIVIGHTYAQGSVTPRFGGKVLMIDVGISRAYDNIGKVGALEIDGGKAFALHRGHKLELPADDNGADMHRYLREAAALDPPPSPLLERIKALDK